MIPMLAKVPDAVGLLTEPVQQGASQPAPSWSWTLPLVAGAVLLGVALVCTGAWFAWNRRQASRDQRDLATQTLAKRAGLSTPELQAIQDLVACVQGNGVAAGQNATTLGLIMSPHAAAELARALPATATDGFDRKQLGRALDKLGAAGALEIKAKPRKSTSRSAASTTRAAKDATGSAPRATPTKGDEAIAARARAVLAAINRAKEQGYFDAKVGSPTKDAIAKTDPKQKSA